MSRALLRRGSRWALVLVTVVATGCITVHEGALAQPPPPEEPLPPDVSMFYNDLLPYGEWVSVADYGWVWHPYGVYAGWAPYTYGHWVYTTDGWTWLSYWSWGWAPFHYGRWFVDGRYGWCWVPGRVWGPSWVLWRYGGGYVGWAPLPPAVAWVPGGIYITGSTVPFVYPGAWVYVQTPYFTATHPRRHFVSPAYRYDAERRTRVETRYEMEGQRVVGRGVPVNDVARATGRPVERHVVVTAPTRGRPAVEGNEVRIYRPPQRGQPAEAQPERYRGREARPAPRPEGRPPSQPSGREAQPQGRPAPPPSRSSPPPSRSSEGQEGGKARPAEPQGRYAPEAQPAEPGRPGYEAARPAEHARPTYVPEHPPTAPERRASEPARPAYEPRPAPPPERHPEARPAQPASHPEYRAPAPPPQRSSEKGRSDGKSQKSSKSSSKSSKDGKHSESHHEGRPAGH